MSPSADELSQKIKRDLQEGDVLVIEKLCAPDTGIYIRRASFEVLIPHVESVRKRLFGLFGKETFDCIKVAKLTELGHYLEQAQLFPRKSNLWDYLIKKENREVPSLKER